MLMLCHHHSMILTLNIAFTSEIMNTRRYGPLRGPTSSSCGGLRPSAEAFFALRAKKELIMLFWPIFGIFWCPVVTLVTLKSENFENIFFLRKKIDISCYSLSFAN